MDRNTALEVNYERGNKKTQDLEDEVAVAPEIKTEDEGEEEADERMAGTEEGEGGEKEE